MEIISTKKAPGAIGPYSQAVIVNDVIYTSGQIPVNPETGEIPDGIENQTNRALQNVKAILEEAGTSLDKVFKTTVFIKDMNDFTKLNAVYSTYFVENPPARSCVEVARLPKDVLVEIEVIAKI